VIRQRYDIFLSYSRADADRVGPLQEELRRLGYKVFLDLESIRVGERWKTRLEASILSSRVLVLCWSAQAKSSEYVQFEYAKAEGLGKPVMPWLLDGTPLPVMVDIQAITTQEAPVAAAALAARIGWNLTRRRSFAVCAAGAVSAAALGVWMRPRNYDFEGVVTDTDSLPISGVVVICENASTLTDSEGRFRLRLQGVKPEWLRLQFSKPGYQTESSYVATGETFQMVLIKAKN
jgi:hypothetical protein